MIENELLGKYYKLIEEENIHFIDNENLSILQKLKLKISKRNILKRIHDKQLKEILNIENIIDRIENNRKIIKLREIYNQNHSFVILKKYVNLKNLLSQKYKFKNFQQILNLKIKSYADCDIDFDKIERNIKNLSFSQKYYHEIINFDNCNIDEYLSYNQEILNYYLYLRGHNQIVERKNFNYGALSLFMPNTRDGIIILKDLTKIDIDYLIHEIGHLLEFKKLSGNDLIMHTLCKKPSKEFYSSFAELQFLYYYKEVEWARKLINNFIFQIKSLFLKIKFEEYLYSHGDELTENNIKLKWERLYKHYFNKNASKHLKLEEDFKLPTESFERIIYFIGRFFAFQTLMQNFSFYEVFDKPSTFDFYDIINMTNFCKNS